MRDPCTLWPLRQVIAQDESHRPCSHVFVGNASISLGFVYTWKTFLWMKMFSELDLKMPYSHWLLWPIFHIYIQHFSARVCVLLTIWDVSKDTMERVSSLGHSRALDTLVPPERQREIWEFLIGLEGLSNDFKALASVGYQTDVMFTGQFHDLLHITVTTWK